MTYYIGCFLAFLEFVGDETLEFIDCVTMKQHRDNMKAIRKRMGWK